MLRWSVHLEGGPRRVNHAAVAVGHRVYSFGGYCSGEDYETLRQIDVHVFNTGRWCCLMFISYLASLNSYVFPFLYSLLYVVIKHWQLILSIQLIVSLKKKKYFLPFITLTLGHHSWKQAFSLPALLLFLLYGPFMFSSFVASHLVQHFTTSCNNVQMPQPC